MQKRRSWKRGEARAWLENQVRSANRDECWVWPFAVQSGGRPSIGRMESPQHLALELDGSPRPEGLHALHTCPGGDNPMCVNPAHLRWGTNAENMRDRDARNQYIRACAKLTPAQVEAIRARYIRGHRYRGPGNGDELAAEFGVTKNTIQAIANYRTWPPRQSRHKP